jgi:hypothetical protein
LQNKAMGTRDGTVEANAAEEVVLIDAISLIVKSKSPAARGCAGRAKVSMTSIGAPQSRHTKVGRACAEFVVREVGATITRHNFAAT